MSRGEWERRRSSRKTHEGICAGTGKRIYRTRKKALKAPAPVGQSWVAFRCRSCGFWHGSTSRKEG